MTSTVKYIEGAVWEDSSPTFFARVKVASGNDLANVQQSDLTSITWKAYDVETLIGSGTLTVADVIYNTLQTGTLWDVDGTGFNFKTQLAAANFPSGNTTYRVEFKFTLTGGTVFWVVFTGAVGEILTS